jgi:hypothetical protein
MLFTVQKQISMEKSWVRPVRVSDLPVRLGNCWFKIKSRQDVIACLRKATRRTARAAEEIYKIVIH